MKKEDDMYYRVYKQKEAYSRHKDGEMVESAGEAEKGRRQWKGERRKSGGEQPGQRKKKRFRPGTMALRKKMVLFLIRKLPFVRWGRKISQ